MINIKKVIPGHYEITLADAPGAYLVYYDRYERKPDHWRIFKLYVPEALRRQGVAKRLMTAITEKADHAGVTLNLSAEPERGTLKLRDLKRFYQSFGFTQISEHECGYKHFMIRCPVSRDHY